ncbi:hypothetical protein ACVJGD_007893 [Bradyrhizobium sp. USDA 10063]
MWKVTKRSRGQAEMLAQAELLEQRQRVDRDDVVAGGTYSIRIRMGPRPLRIALEHRSAFAVMDGAGGPTRLTQLGSWFA